MNIRIAVYVAVAAIALISIAVALNETAYSDNKKIRVAFFPNVGHVVPIVGMEKEIFAQGLGNDTKIETKLFDSGPQVIESLFSKSIDIAYVGPVPAINGFLKSEKEIKILAGAASGGASFIVHPNSNINSVEDFAGKKIATPQIGNTQDVSLRHYISENGLKSIDKGGSVVVLNIANPDIHTLFVKGEIDAAWVPEPWATILVEEQGGKRLFFEEQLWQNQEFASVVLVARSDYVKNNPEIIQAWLDSHVKTVNQINSNSKETVIIFNQFMEDTLGQSLPESIVEQSLSNIEITSDPIADSIYTFAERANSLGYLGRNGYDISEIFYNFTVNSK